jgi:hypothetical protein
MVPVKRLCLEMLPKRSLRTQEEAVRLLSLLDHHLKRV